MELPDHKLTQLLGEWQAGNSQALDDLMPLVYDQLRNVANRYMRAERPGHTLRATAVVHEAYMRLAGSDISFENRAHFYAVAARMMRRILLDWAKSNHRKKRGGEAAKVQLDESLDLGTTSSEKLIEIDLALQRLAAFDPRKADLVEMLFFGGLTQEEAAAVLQISVATLNRELKMAKAWLYNELRAHT